MMVPKNVPTDVSVDTIVLDTSSDEDGSGRKRPSVSGTAGGVNRKASLVQDELNDLEAMRNSGDTDKRFFLFQNKEGFVKRWEEFKFNLSIIRKHPRVLIVPSIIFAILCGGGLCLVIFLAQGQDESQQTTASSLAVETGRWFSDQLDRAILPLFSLAQFVAEIEEFNALAGKVAAAPHFPNMTSHRNTHGICDDPAVLARFNQIAKSIKENANMEGVLVTIQLVPVEVVCMCYPLINTEDFPDGIVYDNRDAIGLDLLAIPARIAYAQSVLATDDIYIAGPVTLLGMGCVPNKGEEACSVKEAFLAALSVDSSNNTISVSSATGKETTYKKWGSVEGIINWKALIARSDIFHRFAREGKGFQLTRTDSIVDTETKEVTTQVVILAQTDDYASSKYSTRVSTELDTVDDKWVMTISYQQTSEDWLPYGIASTIILSFFFSLLILMIQLQKQKIEVIKKRYMEDLAQPQKLRLRMFLDVQESAEPSRDMENQILAKKPIADFFPQCTVFVSDIAGFTSWASEREPSQVFKLLQTVFFHFEKICRARGIFKVETTGDSFIAVAGVPQADPDHAVRMTKFAQECLVRFNALTRELEKQLGPETADLKLRVGLSSGPVVGGVLLGGDSKFHIFGTTVNTAVRMEEMSDPDRIHLSERTAELLVEARKKKWVQARKEKILVKGVGEMQTYYITNKKTRSTGQNDQVDNVSYCSDLSVGSGDMWDDDEELAFMSVPVVSILSEKKDQRLINWQVESLLGLLKKIVAYRNQGRKKKKVEKFSFQLKKGETLLDEVQEIIMLPAFDPKNSALLSSNLDAVEISDVVKGQLRSFVEEIAELYQDNPFHNFAHANHVTMAAHKLLNRIVTPEEVDYQQKNTKKIAADLHDYTFGITSDPLTHFAVVLSALIHDVDHRGVSNVQLSKEIPELGEKYKFQSVAEQNSVDLAWSMLMQPKYADLQLCIFSSRAEYVRFRQLLVNVVLATDIFDSELKALRNMRWDHAFHSDELHRDFDPSFSTDSYIDAGGSDESEHLESSTSERRQNDSRKQPSEEHIKKQKKLLSTNRKATIVIEHIIQAADVSHTMQHWNVYKAWNEKLFQEMYIAYKTGRGPKDPSEGWYKGELWFFDNYIIPLAKKLDECGVFGVASEECLFHAIENRREWALKGESVVDEMVARCQKLTVKLNSVIEEDDDNDEDDGRSAS